MTICTYGIVIFFLVSSLKHKLWLLFRINMGYQQSVAGCLKLTKLLVNVKIINVNITNTLLFLLVKIENHAKDSYNFLNKNNNVFAWHISLN